MRRKRKIGENKLGKLGVIILSVSTILILFPIYWMINTSLKPIEEWMVAPPIWVTIRPTIINYLFLLDPRAFLTYAETAGLAGGSAIFFGTVTDPATKAISDSLIVGGFGTALSLVIGTLAAIAVSREIVKGNFLPMFILSLRMAPPIVFVIPLLILYTIIHWVDTYYGLIFAYGLFTSPYSLWMIKSFIDEIPKELEEVAIIDGLSRLEAFFKVTLPLVKGGIASTALFVFLLNWSEFLLAFTLTHQVGVVTIPCQIEKYFSGTAGTLYGPQAALGVIAIIPPIIICYLIQKWLVRGLTFGAIRR